MILGWMFGFGFGFGGEVVLYIYTRGIVNDCFNIIVAQIHY